MQRLSLTDMASRLGVSAKTFAREVKAKQIPHIVVGKRQRFDAVTVEAYLSALHVKPDNIVKFKPRVAVKGKSRFAEAVGV